MALVTFRWYSRVLEKHVETQLLVPEHQTGRCATFYLLHGLSDDSTMWLRRTRLESDVAGLPLIVVMPDGFRGFYTDNHHGPAFGRYVGEELVAVIDRVFPTLPERGKRSIGGLSMGGYGALRTALTYPDRFISANSHSGAINHGRFDTPDPPQSASDVLLRDVFGPNPRGGPNDLVALAKTAQAAGKLPGLLIDCGDDDFLIDGNVAVHDDLTAAGVPHTFRRFPGRHDWDYWSEHVRDAIAFHAEAMGVH